MLTGCVMSVFFSPTNIATLRVLALNGCDIHIPRGQECCGALAVHSGDREGGRTLARQLIDLFEPLNLDTIVVNAAGCGATMREYERILADDGNYRERSEAFSRRIRDVSEVLFDLPISFPARSGAGLPLRVAYHDACHLAHGQRVRKQPRWLLQQMPGVELLELKESDWCCGSAGTYNLTQPVMADRLLQRKIDHILNTSADILVTGNPGCSLQIARGLRERGSSIQVMHTMDLLSRAYDAAVPGLPPVVVGEDAVFVSRGWMSG
jgi:glycolate oxidase iron-sulfur subunit